MRTEKGAHPQGTAMASENTRQAKLITIASFPINYFVENMAVRADSSILVTVANRNQLWYIPPRNANVPVEPVLLFTFSQSAMGIVEVEPDIFYIATSPVIAYQAAILSDRLFTSHESHLHRLDMRDWAPGMSVKPEVVLQFPEPVRGLNGSCMIAPNIILVADCFASLIWRVDLPSGAGKATAWPPIPAGRSPTSRGSTGWDTLPRSITFITRRPRKNSLCACASTQIHTILLASPNSLQVA
jgi:hypothetical protein